MNQKLFNHLQLREVFHLEFLRWLARELKLNYYALKGGVNLRFFFKSFRYSEDMDLDTRGIEVEALKKAVMKILNSVAFQEGLMTFGITKLIPPDMRKAKQTETTQRFKVHLITSSNEKLFTKIEFSRRGFKGTVNVETVQSEILRVYKSPPLIVPHYDVLSAINQKIEALATRNIIQPRDIFDLYILIPQYSFSRAEKLKINSTKLTSAYKKVFEIEFEQFRDSVISYLSPEDQAQYNSPSLWDEIRLKVANFINELL